MMERHLCALHAAMVTGIQPCFSSIEEPILTPGVHMAGLP